MTTISELQRENRELNDRKEVLELRQENRSLKKQIIRLEAGKSKEIDFHKLKGWIGVGSILFAIGCLLFKAFIV